MAGKIRITAGEVSLEADLSEEPTAVLLWEKLPIEGRANLWGEEIYFEIPLEAPSEPGAREEMEVGEIAYWPPGKAFCIFFGPTPASSGEAPRAASPVNPLGRISGDAKALLGVPQGANISIMRAE
ncbi:MAG: cyclophilin-like fold protein [bacterium]